MAGKSTLLRMTAAAVIMAQIGCYVPAQSAKIAPVDRIASRLGAYDNMFSNSSTFMVELAETLVYICILKKIITNTIKHIVQKLLMKPHQKVYSFWMN